MKPSKLKQQLEPCHGELVGKSADYFRQKSEFIKKNSCLDSGRMWPKQSSIKGTGGKTSRQVHLLYRWKKNLMASPSHSKVIDRWPANPNRTSYSAMTAF